MAFLVAIYVLPVPAGPTANVILVSVCSNDSTYVAWVIFLGITVTLAVLFKYLVSSFKINSSVCSWRIAALNCRSFLFLRDMSVSFIGHKKTVSESIHVTVSI